MKCQASRIPSILWLSVIASVSGTILAKRTRPFNANVEAAACPTGYKLAKGDLPGWGTELGSKLRLTMDECAQKCNGLSSCLSFEHSNSQMLCNLNKIANPTGGPYLDFAFCTKNDQTTTTTATGKVAVGQAGTMNCPGGLVLIRDKDECKAAAKEFGKPYKGSRCYHTAIDKVCFFNGNGIYFTKCNYDRGSTASNHQALCKDPNAEIGLIGSCKTASDCPANEPTCHSEGFCHDPAKCKFVPVKSTECSGLTPSRLPQCFADMSNGEFCNSNDRPLPDGNTDYNVDTCAGIWDIFRCVRGDYTVTEGACRTGNDEDDDVFACDASIANLSACKGKCNRLSECGAVSWDGSICCGLSKKATTTKETAWKCYSK